MMVLSLSVVVRCNTNITMAAILLSLTMEFGVMYLHATLKVTLCLLGMATIPMLSLIVTLVAMAEMDVKAPIAEVDAMISTWTSMDTLVLVCMEHHMYMKDTELYERLNIHSESLLLILICGRSFVCPSPSFHHK